jgi:dihydroxyacetone kinase-like predicted kinase
VVFILPNNKNIVMAAQQCQGLTEKEVIVIPTATVPQGITAMMNADIEEADPQVIAQTMLDAASTVTTAQITYAARNSEFDGFAINERDYLALVNGKLFGTDRDINVLLSKLADLAAEQGAEFVTAFFGEGVDEDHANAAAEIFAQRCPDAEVSALPGGQPVYYYIISIE